MSSSAIENINSADIEIVTNDNALPVGIADSADHTTQDLGRDIALRTAGEPVSNAADSTNAGHVSTNDNFIHPVRHSTAVDPKLLAAQLAQLLESTAVVEELSRRAREAAVGDLAHYESLTAAALEYRRGLEQATTILDKAKITFERAFGQAAKAAAQSLVSEADRVYAAFTHLVDAWEKRGASFLAEHPDVDFLVSERRAQEEEAREQEIALAHARRRDALLAALNSALEAQVVLEARQALATLEREFSSEVDLLRASKSRVVHAIREERDRAARQALFVANQHQVQGNLETAIDTLERVNVVGLSVDVSQDVFGRWCDMCSRLAQETGADLLRYAPTQGRGLILLRAADRMGELQIFSALGMGPEFQAGSTVRLILSDSELRDRDACKRAAAAESILRSARPFRAANVAATTNWSTYVSSPQPAAIVHH